MLGAVPTAIVLDAAKGAPGDPVMEQGTENGHIVYRMYVNELVTQMTVTVKATYTSSKLSMAVGTAPMNGNGIPVVDGGQNGRVLTHTLTAAVDAHLCRRLVGNGGQVHIRQFVELEDLEPACEG